MQYRELLTKNSQNASIPSTEKKDTYSYIIQNLEPKTTYMISVGAKNRHGTNFNEETAYETLAPRKLLDYLTLSKRCMWQPPFVFQSCLVNFYWWIIFVSMQKHWPWNKSMCCLLNLKRCSTPIGHFSSSFGPLYQNKVKYSAFDTELRIFHSHANKTHFHQEGCTLGLILKVWKWPFRLVNMKESASGNHLCLIGDC